MSVHSNSNFGHSRQAVTLEDGHARFSQGILDLSARHRADGQVPAAWAIENVPFNWRFAPHRLGVLIKIASLLQAQAQR